MRDHCSQAKSTIKEPRSGKGRTVFLIALVVISIVSAVCAFSLMPHSAISYAASWPTVEECTGEGKEYELECDVYAYGHYGEADYKYGVSLLFAEAPVVSVSADGTYIFNDYPSYYKITVPGYMSSEGYKCNGANPTFGKMSGASIGAYDTFSSTIYNPTAVSRIYNIENFESYLSSDNYYVRFTKYESIYKDGDWIDVDGTREDIVCPFSIHTDPPSLVSLPSYTNKGFTVESDGNGGIIEKIHITGPDGETYEHRGDTYEFKLSDGWADGQYSIYAEDENGQRSDVEYVYIDRAAPTISWQNNKDCFRITASDNLGDDKVWVADGDGNIVSEGNDYYLKKDGLECGCHEFHAVDAAGNVSETITVVYSAETAMGYFNYETGTASDGEERYLLSFEWVDTDKYTATVKFESADSNYASFDAVSYDGETTFFAEGTYTFVLTDTSTGSDSHTYSFTIGHEWVQADDTDVSTMPCDQKIPFVCLQCGDEKTEGVGTMQHDYAGENGRVFVDATCTECAYYKYTCSKCGYSYDEELPGTENGHNNTYTSFVATCIDDSYWANVCTVCGYVDMEHATIFEGTASGHYYITDDDDPDSVEATCTASGKRISYCERCGDRKEETLPALGHDFSIFAREWYDEENDDMHYYYQCSRCGLLYEEIIYKYKSGTSFRAEDDEGNELLVIWDEETGIVMFSYLSASGEDLSGELVVYIGWGDDFVQVSAPEEIDLGAYGAMGDFTVTVYGRGDAELGEFTVTLSDDSLDETEENEDEDAEEESGSMPVWAIVVIVVAVVVALAIIALVVYLVLSHNRKKKGGDDGDDWKNWDDGPGAWDDGSFNSDD